ncbi:cobalt-precorrin-5B (C(1))-methyltransferase [Acuticoccus sp. 2012]|uniref:Cobalt-precorrin-5B C(1)-methyltransferase n=1 Tax=Acuticoccus mangrovi TaxID=2796142 RepID=A0A934MIL6_9HYPH|nr:cobalt-precorrin-5B (C(1))-methyltransferase [Acuticoccus mangrovi]
MGESDRPLRSGWTTGACATAAAKAAYAALLTGAFPDPVAITLPRGGTASFALAEERLGEGEAMAGVVKDAGDDPDVTHGATVWARVRRRAAGGVAFVAGEGVGTVTRQGLPIDVGEPAINPVPRRMIATAIAEVAAQNGADGNVVVTIGVVDGERLAARTWNPRLGILGGLSILGTTGIVTPYSCSAWIHSIHRGIDVARAEGVPHVAAATGSTSERTAQTVLGLPDHAMLDMGDFAGGVLKYLRDHPVPRLTIAGGFAKLSKLAAGALDLHSSRSEVDMGALGQWAAEAGVDAGTVAAITAAPTAMAALAVARERGAPLADLVAVRARAAALKHLRGAPVAVGILVVDRKGEVVAHV